MTNTENPSQFVTISSFVVARPDSTFPVIIKPYKLDLTQFGEKVRDEVTFKMTNVSDEKIDVSMVSFAYEYFEVDLPSRISPGETAEVTLKLKKDAMDKEFEKSFTMQVSGEGDLRFTVPVKRKLRPSIQQAGTDTEKSDKSKP
jgi:hypothetical protein